MWDYRLELPFPLKVPNGTDQHSRTPLIQNVLGQMKNKEAKIELFLKSPI
jgi:hypothetical protein